MIYRRIVMTRGDTYVLKNLIMYDRDDQVIDLTGAKIWMTAKKRVGDTTPVFQLKSFDGAPQIVINDAKKGDVTVTIKPSDTSSLPNTIHNLRFDLQVKKSDGSIETVMYGELVVGVELTTES